MLLPYGGFDYTKEYEKLSSWERLTEIQKSLERDEKIPPFLARWLGEAIARSAQDYKELLCCLDLKKRQGAQSKYPENAWVIWGKKVHDLVSEGLSIADAMKKVLDEASEASESGETFSNSALLNWFNIYREAHQNAQNIK